MLNLRRKVTHFKGSHKMTKHTKCQIAAIGL